jgi:low affinity Fe/Cu permease
VSENRSQRASSETDVQRSDASRTKRPVLSRLAFRIAQWTGSGELAALVATFSVGWIVVGVATDFPHWWELAITIGVPLISLQMLVVVQHTQSHSTQATQLKLDELLRATERATNDLVAVEDASSSDLDRLHASYADVHLDDGSPEDATS